MTQVYLSRLSQEAVKSIVQSALPASMVIIITPDAKTDTLVARFVEHDIVEALRTRHMGEAIPGVDVYLFGVDGFPSNFGIELILLPVTTGTRPEIHNAYGPDYLLRVRVAPLYLLESETAQHAMVS